MPYIFKPVTYKNLFTQDCDNSLPGQNARCSTCMNQGGVVNNICADPEKTAVLCSPSGSFSTLCSCGQLYPEPQRIWPLKERDRFINENKNLGGQREGDAGNYLLQPVAAAPEIDFTGFKDETASSAQAEMMPSDGDWTVWFWVSGYSWFSLQCKDNKACRIRTCRSWKILKGSHNVIPFLFHITCLRNTVTLDTDCFATKEIGVTKHGCPCHWCGSCFGFLVILDRMKVILFRK